jgi:hypothetical protein
MKRCEKNTVKPFRPQVTTWPIRFALCIRKDEESHSEYVIPIPFPRQNWLRERTSIVRNTCIAVSVLNVKLIFNKHIYTYVTPNGSPIRCQSLLRKGLKRGFIFYNS